MDHDGTKGGFDNVFLKKVNDAVHIPVIASGGAGSVQHFVDVFEQTNVDAALAASVFHYGEILIPDLKEILRKNNIEVRITNYEITDKKQIMNIDFNKSDGLVPVIIQDEQTLEVLMLGYMNQEAYDKTVAENIVTFFSRSKNRLWTKGETSKNFLHVKSIHRIVITIPCSLK